MNKNGGMLFSDIDTPALLIDSGIMHSNLMEMQAFADKNHIKLRPHVKTHKIPGLAKSQIKYGAVGIAVAKLSEAEVMVDGGISDVQIASQIVGPKKIERLFDLAGRATVSCAVDSPEGVEAISAHFQARNKTARVLIEVDIGLNRCGLADPAGVVELGKLVTELKGVELSGIMTHAGHAYAASNREEVKKIGVHEGEFMVDIAGQLEKNGINVKEISVGSTPTARFSGSVAGVTELRPGNYIFNDMTQVALGTVDISRCALSVLATVISTPYPGRAVLDAGSKAFALDRGGHGSESLKGFGHILGKAGTLARLSEEHGIIEFEKGKYQVGERVRIIPNHACPVMNLFDIAYLLDGSRVDKLLKIEARGKSS